MAKKKTEVQGFKWVYETVPVFLNDTQKSKYWEEEKRRWTDGHNGLTGIHYFYLTQCFIKSGTSGEHIRPRWRDVDALIFGEIEKAIKTGKSLFVIKRREVGLTSIGGGCLPNYFMRVFAGSTSLLTGRDQSGAYKMFDDKTMVGFDNLNPDIKPEILRKNATKSSVYLKVQVKVKKSDGSVTTQDSDIYCKETTEKPKSVNAFSGTRAKYGFIDEAALHSRLPELLKSIMPCFMEGVKRTGFLLLGGTIEESLKNEDIAKLKDLVLNSEALEINTLFIAGWMGLEEFEVDGVSDQAKGTEWIMKKRAEYDKMDDKSFLNAFIKNYPLTIDEVLEFGSGTRFEEDVCDLIKNQIKAVETAKQPIVKGVRLVESENGISAISSTNGNIEIYEQPKQGLDYVIGIDGVATGTEQVEEGSHAASIVVKGFDPNGDSYGIASLYYCRPKSVEESYIDISNQAKYYINGLKVIEPEGNMGTSSHFGTFLKKIGLFHFLKPRKDLSGKGYVDTRKIGTYVTADVREWQMRQANSFLRKNISSIKCLPLLYQMLLPVDKNADILDAWLMTFIARPFNFWDAPVKKEVVKKKRELRIIHPDGREEWISV